MIVQCDQCQTRFKIPDEKVTEKGVKVRCTRCQHTFRVSRAPAAAVPPPAPIAPDFDELDAPTRVGSLSPELLASLRAPEPPPAPSPPPPPPPPAFDPFALDATSPAAPVYNPAAMIAPEPPPPAPAFDPFELPHQPAPSPTPEFDPFELPPDAGDPPSGQSSAAADPLGDPFALDSRGAPDPLAQEDVGGGGFEPADPFGGDAFEPSNPFGGDELTAAPAAATEDPFAQMSGPEFGSEPDARAMFDVPSKPAARSSSFETSTETSTNSSAALALNPPADPAPAPKKPAGVPLGALKVSGPAKNELADAPTRRRTGRGLVAAILNIGIAAVLVAALLVALSAWVQGGRVDASTFTVENLKALFAPPSSVVAVDVTNGLYLTREGREVFYVRGEAENRSEQAQRVRVQVEVLDGSQRVKVASVLAGSNPSPEALHAVTTREQLEALRAELDKNAVTLAPGARAPFLVPFFEYPPNLGSYQLRVTILPESGEAGGGGETAKR